MRHSKEKGGGRREKVSALVRKTLRSACGGVELKYDGVPLRRTVVGSRIVGRHYARPDFGHTFVSLFPFLRALYGASHSPRPRIIKSSKSARVIFDIKFRHKIPTIYSSV